MSRLTIERRTEDQRTCYDLGYFMSGGSERRQGLERRNNRERRAGWLRAESGTSLYLGSLVTVEDKGLRDKVVPAPATPQEDLDNRRRFDRAWIRKHSYVILHPADNHPAEIIDISLSGLSFMTPTQEEPVAPESFDIYLLGESFYVREVRFRTVDKRTIAPDFELTFTPMVEWRVEFLDLDADQVQRLKHIFDVFATNSVPY